MKTILITSDFKLSLLVRGRILKIEELKKTTLGIIRSTAFLSVSTATCTAYTCMVRAILGNFNFWTASFIPAFISSFTAIWIERESRRSLLTMYMGNIGAEALWRMAESRNLVKSIPKGQVLIFGVATSFLVYYFRAGVHLTTKDSVFDIVRFIVGRDEEGGLSRVDEAPSKGNLNRFRKFFIIQRLLRLLSTLTSKLKPLPKHEKCPHKLCFLYNQRRSKNVQHWIGNTSLAEVCNKHSKNRDFAEKNI